MFRSSVGSAELPCTSNSREKILAKMPVALSAHIDAVTLSAVLDDRRFYAIKRLLAHRFGEHHPQTRQTRRYRECYVYPDGVTLERGNRCGGFDGADDHVVVSLKGLAMGKLLASGGIANQVAAISELTVNGLDKCTRLDLAVDVRSLDGHEIPLIAKVKEAVEARQYPGRSRFSQMTMSRCGRVVKGLTFYIGKRGSFGSGQLVRVYDKGLETRTMSQNQWIRWEVEFGTEGKRSQQALQRIFNVDFSPFSTVGWRRGEQGLEDLLISMAFGVIDFRHRDRDDDDPQGDRFWRDCPRLEWWSELLAGVDVVRLRFIYKPSDMRSQIVYLRQAASVLKAWAQASKRDMLQVIAQLGLFDVEASKSVGTWNAAREFASYDEAEYLGPLVT